MDNKLRGQIYAELYKTGRFSLAKLGEGEGITKQRVHQLIELYDPFVFQKILARRKALRKAQEKPKPTPLKTVHGTENCYHESRCRCDACREGHRVYMHKIKMERIEKAKLDPSLIREHGNSAYHNWGCRCEICTEANKTRCKEYYMRQIDHGS